MAARPSFKLEDEKCPSSTPPRPLSSFFTFFRVAEWKKWGKRVSQGLRENALCPGFLTGPPFNPSSLSRAPLGG